MSLLKPNILRMSDYAVEQDSTRTKLNQNESSLDVSEILKKQIGDRMLRIDWNRYPPGQASALIEAISHYTGFPASGIAVGNGSNEIIQTLVYATCDSGDTIVLVTPCFSVYKRVADIMNVEVLEVPLVDDFRFDVDGLIEAGQHARIMLLSTPNNPTGTTLQPDQIKKMAANVPCLVAVDEAYYEFSGKTMQPFLEQFDNMVVLRTFSKALRLANLRIGYLMGRTDLIYELAKCRLPFSVGVFQQIAGEVILQNTEILLTYADSVRKERDRVYKELRRIEGIKPIPSEANFILFENRKTSGRELYKALFDRGILIRYFGGSLLENWLRVTIGTAEENDLFLKALRNIAGDE